MAAMLQLQQLSSTTMLSVVTMLLSRPHHRGTQQHRLATELATDLRRARALRATVLRQTYLTISKPSGGDYFSIME